MGEATLLLVPGLVSDSRVWRAVGEASPLPMANGDVTRDDRIEAMAARLLEEHPGVLVVAGHSLGGRVAIEMARQAPQRIAGLILANTGHNALQPGEAEKRQAKIALAHRDMRALVEEWLPPMVAPSRRADAALMQSLGEMVLAAGPQVHERQVRALVERPDAGVTLPNIACPVLLMTGSEDGWSPERQHREIESMLNAAQFVPVEGAGHFMPVEMPAETVAAVTGWLARRVCCNPPDPIRRSERP